MATPHALRCKLSLDDFVFFQKRLDAPTTPQRDLFRIRIVLLAHQGYTNQQIAQLLGCHDDSVRKWRNRFACSGQAGLVDAPRPGRPRAFSPAPGRRCRRLGL